MDVVKTAQNCLDIVTNFEGNWPMTPEKSNRMYTAVMLKKIISGEHKGEGAHRLLGWAQCSMYMVGDATTDDLKETYKES
jgi:hypothetical protein